MVDPVVKVTIVEYYSRPISVAGAVRKPVTFQATGNVTLLEALSRAEGLSPTPARKSWSAAATASSTASPSAP